MVSPGLYCATPTDTVSGPIERTTGMSSVLIRLRSRSASSTAPASAVCGRIWTNSATIPSEDIRRAQAVPHGPRECLEDLISGQVIEFVVVAFEEVEVDHADREWFVGSIGPLYRLFHGDHQSTTVVDASQIVIARLFLDTPSSLMLTSTRFRWSRFTLPPINTSQGNVIAITTN